MFENAEITAAGGNITLQNSIRVQLEIKMTDVNWKYLYLKLQREHMWNFEGSYHIYSEFFTD